MIDNAKYAEDGSIVAVINGVEWQGIHEGSRFWQEVENWRADGNVIEPFIVSIDQLRAQAKVRVNAFADRIGARFTAGYPNHEIASWPVKMAEALAVEAGGTDAPMLSVEAQVLGTDVTTLAARIVAKGTIYREAAALIAALRQTTGAAIDAAQTADEITTVLKAAEADAEARYKALTAP